MTRRPRSCRCSHTWAILALFSGRMRRRQRAKRMPERARLPIPGLKESFIFLHAGFALMVLPGFEVDLAVQLARIIAIYFFTLFMLRIAGKRRIAHLSAFDILI